MFKYRVIYIMIGLMLYNCQKRNKTPLLSALDNIEKSWTKEQLKSFSQKTVDVAVYNAYFEEGLLFRNNELLNPKDSILIKYFNSLDVYNKDYMFSLVFESLHNRLNNKSINFKEKIKKAHAITDQQDKINKKNINRSLKYYSKFNIGDTIIIRMPMKRYNNATQYSNPEDSGWIHNDSLDLLIKGVIKSKSKITNSTDDIPFKVKILSMNHEKVKILMRNVKVGDVIESDFIFDIVTPAR